MSIENPTLAHFSHFRHYRHFIFLYNCREFSTNHLLFMQNKPNFRKSQMNLKFCKQMDYENKRDWTIGENKPNSNPISSKPKMNLKSLTGKSGTPEPGTLDLTKDKCYRLIVNMIHYSIRKGVKTNASAIKSS